MDVVVVVELVPVPGRRADVVEVTRRNSQRVIAAKVGCSSFTIDDQEPDGPVVVLTRWRDDGSLQAHLATQMAADNLQSYVGLLVEPMVPKVMPPRPTD